MLMAALYQCSFLWTFSFCSGQKQSLVKLCETVGPYARPKQSSSRFKWIKRMLKFIWFSACRWITRIKESIIKLVRMIWLDQVLEVLLWFKLRRLLRICFRDPLRGSRGQEPQDRGIIRFRIASGGLRRKSWVKRDWERTLQPQQANTNKDTTC